MKIRIERYIEQVKPGSHYRGYVKIANTRFDYELEFRIPIQPMSNVIITHDLIRMRRVYPLTLKRDGSNIVLTDEEFAFFLSLLLRFATEFHLHHINRSIADMNSGLASGSIGVVSSGICDFSRELCEILEHDKFGCVLTG